MRRKFLLGIMLTAMIFSLTACGSDEKVNRLKEVSERGIDEKKDKFKEVDGKVEVYLPVHYIHSELQESYDNELIVQNEGNMKYDNNGLLLKAERHEEDNSDGFSEYNYTNSCRYNTKYQLAQVKDESGEGTEKEIEQFSYHYQDGILSSIEESQDGYTSYYAFDKESGLLLKEEHYGSDYSGTVTRTYTYTYDKDANIKRYDKNYNSTVQGSSYEGSYVYEYNEIGNVIKQIHTDYSGTVREKNIVYDKDGYITSCDDIEGDNMKIKYNNQHKPVMIAYGDRRVNYEYENSLISKISYVDWDGKKRKLSFKYDENDNIIEVSSPIDNNFKVSIEYDKYYVDKEYFDYYLNCYYYLYSSIPLSSLDYDGLCITLINNDVLQGALISEFSNLPYIRIEHVYTGTQLKADVISK